MTRLLAYLRSHTALPEVDGWLAEACAVVDRPNSAPASLQSDIELDQPKNAEDFILHLKRIKPAVEGKGGERWTMLVAAFAKDYAISEDLCLELVLEHFNARCEPPWEYDELKTKLHNGYVYCRDNPVGAKTAQGEFADANLEYPPQPVSKLVAKQLAERRESRRRQQEDRTPQKVKVVKP